MTNFAASVFTVSALIGLLWVAISGPQMLLAQRHKRDDPVDRIG